MVLTEWGGRPRAAPRPIMTAVPRIPTSSATQIMPIIAHDRMVAVTRV